MAKRMAVVFGVFVLAAVIFSYQNCGKSPFKSQGDSGSPSGPVTVTGKIQQNPNDECHFLFHGDDQNEYQLVGLDPSLKKDGAVLKVEGEIRTDMVGSCMRGQFLQVKTAVAVP
jgi:hypothetical protein